MAADREQLRRWREPGCDLYGALGLARSASPGAVRRAFRRKALACHPDKVPAEERESATRHFKLIAEAYQVLGSDALRQQYDHIRAAGTDGPSSTPLPRGRRGSGAAQEEPQEACAGCEDLCPPASLGRCRKCPRRVCRRCALCWDCLPGFGEEPQEEGPEGRGSEGGVGLEPLLLAMGFGAAGARAAGRCTSAAAAVELLMAAAAPGAAAPGAEDPAQRRGALDWLLEPWLPWASAASDVPPAGDAGGSELAATLVELGFSRERSEAAARRCSTPEAAVEWLLAHPEAEA